MLRSFMFYTQFRSNILSSSYNKYVRPRFSTNKREKKKHINSIYE